MKKLQYSGAMLIISVISGCAAILDGYHKHTGIYLPHKVGELSLTKDVTFDREGKDIGYFYQSFDKENFVTSIIYIYPINSTDEEVNVIVKELSDRYPKLEQKQHVFTRGKAQFKGKYISFIDIRDFANKKNQTVRNIVYLTELGDDWFIKFHCAYQDSVAETAQPVVDCFLIDFSQTLEIKKNDYL